VPAKCRCQATELCAVKIQKFTSCTALLLAVEVSNLSSHLTLRYDAWTRMETQVQGSFILRFQVFWHMTPSHWISEFSNFSKGFWEEGFVKFEPLYMKATCSYRTLGNFSSAMQHYIPADRYRRSHYNKKYMNLSNSVLIITSLF
jgi:hypothetical protein